MGHIVRVDKPKDDFTKGTHGWQVRSSGKRGYHSKLFSDNVHGGRQQALLVAEEYLADYKREHPQENIRQQYPHGFKESGLQGNNKSGVNGVYRSREYKYLKNGSVTVHYYWLAFCPIGPAGQRNKWRRSYYVSKYGEDEARRLAIEFRKGWEEAARQGEEALKEFFQREFYDKMEFPEPPGF